MRHRAARRECGDLCTKRALNAQSSTIAVSQRRSLLFQIAALAAAARWRISAD